MLSNHEVRQIVGIVGNVVSFGMFISPWHTFYKIWKNKDVEGLVPGKYILNVLTCVIWIFYGLPFVHRDCTLVYTSNSIGLALQIIFLGIYYIYANEENRKRVVVCLCLEASLMLLVGSMVLGSNNFYVTSATATILCLIVYMLIFICDTAIMENVIKTKDATCIPFWLTFTQLVNGCIWITYAMLKPDIYMLVIYCLGALSSFCQLVLYAIYYDYQPTRVGVGNVIDAAVQP